MTKCPMCKRMVVPEFRDGVAVWKWHGTMTLGRGGIRACPKSLKPLKPLKK